MNRKISGAVMAALMLVPAASCGMKKQAEKLADAAEEIISDEYRGILSSSAKYSYTDTKSQKLRDELCDEVDFDGEWLIIADKGDFDIYYAEDCTSSAVKLGGKKQDESIKEIYKEEYKNYDGNNDGSGILSYVARSKVARNDAAANTVFKIMNTIFVELEEENYNISGIERIIIENDKITEIVGDFDGGTELLNKKFDAFFEYYQDSIQIPYACVLCSNGVADEVYLFDSPDGYAVGEYPASNSDEKISIEDIIK